MAQLHALGATISAHARGEGTTTAALRTAGVSLAPDSHPLAESLYEYVAERGFHFPRELVTRYLLALRTRPFALFTGISGTGKTKLALLTAEYFANVPGTKATRVRRPVDGEGDFYVKIDPVTLRSGTLTPGRDQLDYFNVPVDSSEPFTATITNVLGAHGDITFRATNLVAGGRKHLTIQVPASVRRAFEATGVTDRDYLRFEIVEEFKRYRVSLHRPEEELVEVPAEDRYAFVSVRPNWDDHTALLGSWDAATERYDRTPVLELLLRAGREERDARAAGVAPAPYFLVLDEMNLAKIEHYFSDFLSILESRRSDVDGTIRQEALHLHSADATRPAWIDNLGVEHAIPERLEIPTNVLITGTLNLDDTTHGISPKVIDRAHTLAFNTVDLGGFLRGTPTADVSDPLELPGAVTRDLGLGDLALSSAEDSAAMAEHLAPFVRLNDVLLVHDQHFGYRVLNDIALFLRATRDLIGDDPAVLGAATDAAVLQKVLPRFYVWNTDRGGLVATLLEFCLDGSVREQLDGTPPDPRALLSRTVVDRGDRAQVRVDGVEAGDAGELRAAYLPRSAGRLARMLRTMTQPG